MAQLELLGPHVHEKTRWFRMRWILALDEAARLGRAATWEEWNKIWFHGEAYTPAAARKALTRLSAELRELGVRLDCSQDHFVDGRGRALRALVEPWLERARRLDEEIAERRRAKKCLPVQELEDDLDDDVVGENVVLDPSTVVAEYRIEWKQASEIGHLHRIGCGRVLKILHAKGVVREQWEQRHALERARPQEILEEALAAFDEGAQVREVAAILSCSTKGAWRFLRRNGRSRERALRVAQPHLSRT